MNFKYLRFQIYVVDGLNKYNYYTHTKFEFWARPHAYQVMPGISLALYLAWVQSKFGLDGIFDTPKFKFQAELRAYQVIAGAGLTTSQARYCLARIIQVRPESRLGRSLVEKNRKIQWQLRGKLIQKIVFFFLQIV